MEEDYTFSIPNRSLAKTAGFSIDCGSATFRVAQATDAGDSSTVRLREFTTFEDAVCHIKSAGGDKLSSELTTITGCNRQQYQSRVQQELDTGPLEVVSELESLLDGFSFLRQRLSLDETWHDINMAAVEHGKGVATQIEAMFTAVVNLGQMINWETWEAADNPQRFDTSQKEMEYPVLLVDIGDKTTYIKINEDGTCVVTEAGGIGGEFLSDVGFKLTETKTQRELERLAQTGIPRKVNIHTTEALDQESDSSVYQDFVGLDFVVFHFGHAINKAKGDFKREDIAAALIQMVARCITIACVWPIYHYDIRHIVFSGSLVSASPLLRDQLASSLEERLRCNVKGVGADFSMLKIGGYVGVLGALMKSLEHT